MGKINGSALMFDEHDVRTTRKPLPLLARVMFYGLSITNNGYIERYRQNYFEKNRDRSHKEFSQQAAANRKFLLDKDKLTFGMLTTIAYFMGWDIECVSIRIRDRLTDTAHTFSTDDKVEDLKRMIEKENQIGIQSFD